MPCAQCPCSLVVQGKKFPMMSSKDLSKLFKRLKKRERKEGKVRKIVPVAAIEAGAAVMPVEGAVGCAVEIAPVPGEPTDAVGDADIAKGTRSPLMMPPPKFLVAAPKYNSMISKKLCDITQFPEFAVESHLKVHTC